MLFENTFLPDKISPVLTVVSHMYSENICRRFLAIAIDSYAPFGGKDAVLFDSFVTLGPLVSYIYTEVLMLTITCLYSEDRMIGR